MEEIKKEVADILNINVLDIINVKRFKQGMSNYTYKIETNKDSYVFRKIGIGANKFTNYYNELNNLSLAINNHITSDLIYFDVNTGTKLSKYIKGEDANLKDDKIFESTILTLKKMHSLKNDKLEYYDLSKRLNLYESYLDTNVLSNTYFLIKEFILKTYNTYYKDTPKVFCHNDLQEANIIYNKETNETLLIDFEFAALNDLYYDLASIEYSPELVYEKYFNEKPNNDSLNHILFYKMYQSLQWHLVATYKDIKNFSEHTNYDFNYLADYFLNNAFSIYDKLKEELK